MMEPPLWTWLSVAVVLAAGGLSLSNAQLTEPGICPFSTPLADWNEAQFAAGPWYQIKAFPLAGMQDEGPECTTWHLTPSGDGRGLGAHLQYRPRGFSDRTGAVTGFAQYAGKENYPRFNFTFNDIAGGSRFMEVKLVASDYNDFALLWGCSEPNLFERRVVSWLLSRQPVLSQSAQEAVAKLLRRHDIRPEKFVDTTHEGCNHPPTAFRDVGSEVQRSAPSPIGTAADGQDQGTLDGVQEVAPRTTLDKSRDNADALVSEHNSAEAAETVSWSYVGDVMSPQLALLAVLLAFAAVSLVASLFAFRALLQRKMSKTQVLPMRRQDVTVQDVSTLSSGVVDYTRFGFGSLVQTRKPGNGAQPRLHM